MKTRRREREKGVKRGQEKEKEASDGMLAAAAAAATCAGRKITRGHVLPIVMIIDTHFMPITFLPHMGNVSHFEVILSFKKINSMYFASILKRNTRYLVRET